MKGIFFSNSSILPGTAQGKTIHYRHQDISTIISGGLARASFQCLRTVTGLFPPEKPLAHKRTCNI
jgi:hypothetical protein